MEYMSRNPEKELSTSSKKRKSESSNNNNSNLIGVNNGNSESSSTDEESCKKPREQEIIKAKISRAYVRTEASDTGLVRYFNIHLIFNLDSLVICGNITKPKTVLVYGPTG